MRIYWLNPPISTRTFVADTAWMNFSSYLRNHEWIEPIIDWEPFKTVEDIVNDIKSKKPDMVCMSTYIWNEKLCLEVAKHLDGITIVRGGPQQSSSENIDHNCPPLVSGELFLKELLDGIKENKFSFSDESALEYNITYLINLVGLAKSQGKSAVGHLETTRGCPYSCTYCEWGGGISTKITQKPYNVVIKEIEIFSVLQFNNVDIIDANFGILKRDIDFINEIAAHKRLFGYPKQLLIYGIAKVKAEKKEKILDIAFENDLMDYYSLSIQTVSDEALKNVKRTDIPLDDNLKLARKYAELYNKHGKLELILGLPGSTIDTFYAEMDLVLHTKFWDWSRGPLSVLPATELANTLYQRLHKIKTTKAGITENDDNDICYVSDCVLTKYKSPQEFVIESYSFTSEEWKEMFFMNYAQRAFGPTVKDGQLPSIELRKRYQEIQEFDWFKNIKREIDKIVLGERLDEDFLLYDGLRIEDWVQRYLDGLDN
jgi:hypothetical protein